MALENNKKAHRGDPKALASLKDAKAALGGHQCALWALPALLTVTQGPWPDGPGRSGVCSFLCSLCPPHSLLRVPHGDHLLRALSYLVLSDLRGCPGEAKRVES